MDGVGGDAGWRVVGASRLLQVATERPAGDGSVDGDFSCLLNRSALGLFACLPPPPSDRIPRPNTSKMLCTGLNPRVSSQCLS